MKVNFRRRADRKKEAICVHFGSATEYSWSVPDGMDIQVNDVVWVDTQYGANLARVLRVIDSRGIAEKKVLGRITSMKVDES